MHISSLLLAFICSLWSETASDNWPRFRGPRGDGHANATELPIKWSESENVQWKTAIHGKGWSSPVVWGDQIWLTTATADGHEMFGVCVDRATGKIVHDLKIFENQKPAFCHPFNSYASPTPVIEEGRVYLHFGTYGTACLDTATGRVLWTRRDLLCDHWRGPGSSPILHANLLIVHFDGHDVQYVVALDKKSGQTVWKKDRAINYGTEDGDFKKAFGTPAIVEVNGKPLLISPSAMATIAYEPFSGAEIWKVYHGGMNVAVPPLWGHGRVFITTGDGGFKLLAVRPDGSGDVTKSHVDWTWNKGVPSRCGPLLIDDLFYFVNETGIVTCLEAKTGQQVWQKRLGGAFSASGVYAHGRIFFCDQDGLTHVMAPGRVAKILAVNPLNEGCMASPAIAGNAIFLRSKTHLYRIQQQ